MWGNGHAGSKRFDEKIRQDAGGRQDRIYGTGRTDRDSVGTKRCRKVDGDQKYCRAAAISGHHSHPGTGFPDISVKTIAVSGLAKGYISTSKYLPT